MAGVCFKLITPSARVAGYESTQSTLVSGKSEMCPEFQQVRRLQRNQAADRNIVRCSDLSANGTNNETGAFLLAVIRMRSEPNGLPPRKPAKIVAR